MQQIVEKLFYIGELLPILAMLYSHMKYSHNSHYLSLVLSKQLQSDADARYTTGIEKAVKIPATLSEKNHPIQCVRFFLSAYGMI